MCVSMVLYNINNFDAFPVLAEVNPESRTFATCDVSW